MKNRFLEDFLKKIPDFFRKGVIFRDKYGNDVYTFKFDIYCIYY